jgi:hypothetical protein
VLLILGTVLYVLGFLTMSSYLARFGIVTFDIFNARFVVAGIITALPLAFVFWVSWKLANVAPLREVFKPEGSPRLWLLLILPGTANFAGSTFAAIYRFGAYVAPMPRNATQFHPLGPWDFIGAHLPLEPAPSWVGFVLCYTALVVAYVGVPIIVVYGLAALIRHGLRARPGATRKPSQPAVPPSESTTPAPKPAPTGWRLHLVWFRASVVLVILLMQLIYAYLSLRTALADFWTLDNSQFDSSAMGYWLLLSIGGVYAVLDAYDVPRKGLAKSVSEGFGRSHGEAAQLLNMSLVPLLGSILLFGSCIFPRVSYVIGGGQPRPIVLPDGNALGTTAKDHVLLLGESSQHYFVVVLRDSVGRAIQVSKGLLPMIVTRTTDSLAFHKKGVPNALPITTAASSPDSLERTQHAPGTGVPTPSTASVKHKQ